MSSHTDLNDHHRSVALNYLRFARFQRGQCLKAVQSCLDEASETRFPDPTYTVDEVREALSDVSQEVSVEVEAELLSAAHTNVLLLQQVFAQAQRWHLDLDADLAELENRELLDKVKSWEDSELSGQQVGERPSLSPLKRSKLSPLTSAEGGPAQLLRAQLEDQRKEGDALRRRVAELERAAAAAAEGRAAAAAEAAAAAAEAAAAAAEAKAEAAERKKGAAAAAAEEEEVKELEEAVKSIRFQMASEHEVNAKNQRELEGSLKDAKHALLDVQHQLRMAEKELEKKFSQTGAYKNLKKMLSSKNCQIRDLRAKLAKYEGGREEEEEEE